MACILPDPISVRASSSSVSSVVNSESTKAVSVADADMAGFLSRGGALTGGPDSVRCIIPGHPAGGKRELPAGRITVGCGGPVTETS
ncbi:hypothetical protein GCM10027256_03670 [Novispirillum itersonii subsp. nipponicum]